MLFQGEQTVGFLRRDPLYGNARPLCHDIRNVIFRNDDLCTPIFAPTGGIQLGAQFLLTVAQLCCRLIVLPADRRILFLYNIRDLHTQTRNLVRIADILHAHT